MIDENRLIKKLERLQKIVFTYNFNVAHVCDNLLCEIKDFINEQPKINEWIPVEERLPKHNGEYLVTAINESGGIYMAVAIYDSQYKTFCSSGDGDDDNAIAWQPLPEPYRVPLEKNSKGETE